MKVKTIFGCSLVLELRYGLGYRLGHWLGCGMGHGLGYRYWLG